MLILWERERASLMKILLSRQSTGNVYLFKERERVRFLCGYLNLRSCSYRIANCWCVAMQLSEAREWVIKLHWPTEYPLLVYILRPWNLYLVCNVFCISIITPLCTFIDVLIFYAAVNYLPAVLHMHGGYLLSMSITLLLLHVLIHFAI
jgi:hypothetical protein